MPLPEAERLQELEQAMRAGRRFTIVVAEREDGNGYTLVHGAGILAAAREARLDAVRAIILPYGSLVDVLSDRINELEAELRRLQPDELTQAHEQIAALTAEDERLKTVQPAKSRSHPYHEGIPSPRERVLRGQLVEMRLESRPFFITRDMMNMAYRIRDRYKARALTKAEAFEALERIAAA